MAGQPKSPRSGGPKTQAGKAIASQNSIKAGVYTQVDLLPHEDVRERVSIEQLFIDDLRPIGMVEFVLVQSLVKIAWKKLRLEKMEARVLADCLAKLSSLSDLQKAGVENYPASSEPYVANPELIASLSAKEIRQAIWALEEFRQRGLCEELLGGLESSFPNVYQKLKQMLDDISGEELSDFDMANSKYYWSAPTTPIGDAVEKLIAHYQGELWAIENYERLLKAKQEVEDKRLLEFLKTNSTQRAHDDLDRAYSRALKDLRVQQTWRKNQGVIKGEVTPIKAIKKPKKK
jgi:Asp-tRNA(Asn)/Glu-tRNA(Gln) amidotransferase A subunit family amidase